MGFEKTSAPQTFSEALAAAGGTLGTLDHLIEGSGLGLYVDRVDEGCIWVNSAFARMFGRSAEECLGFGWARAIHPDDVAPLQEKIEAFERTQAATVVEYRTVHKDGRHHWVRARVRALLGDDGEHLGSVCTIQDITAERRFQDRSQETQKLEAVGRLAGRIAHDFNNLLTAIMGCAHLVGLDEGLTDDSLTALDTLDQACAQARTLTDQLLTVSRRRLGHRRTVALDGELGRLRRLLEGALGGAMQLELQLGCPSRHVPIDSGQLGQILVNLAVNARDASEGKGKVRIRTRLEAEQAWLHFEDEGPGMPAETCVRIFEPFFTTKGEGFGTGLGLSTVRDIIKRAGGDITVDSTVGAGTRFAICLPAHEGQPEAPELDAGTVRRLRGARRVLLVEDQDFVRLTAAHSLALVGHDVLAAFSRDDARARLDEAAELPDVAVLDVMLPDGSGPDVVAELDARGFEGPVIYTSGFTGDALPPAALHRPDTHFLPKPYTARALLELVAEALGDATTDLE